MARPEPAAEVDARRYDTSRAHALRGIEANPTAEENYRILGLALAQRGQLAEAERVLREARTLPGAGAYEQGVLGYVLALAGQEAEARALDCLERAYAERRGWMAYLKVNPLMDPLRGEERFQALIAKMGLTHNPQPTTY